MYQASEGYRACIDTNNRPRFRAQLLLPDGTVLTDEIKSAELTSQCVPGSISIGNACAACLKLTLQTEVQFENQRLEYAIKAILPGDTEEIIPMGVYTVETVERNEGIVTVTAYDNLKRMDVPYVSSLTYPASAADVAAELSRVTGIEISPDVVYPDLQIKAPIAGYTAREAAGKLAERMGCNVVADRYGRMDFRWFTPAPVIIDADDRITSLKRRSRIIPWAA